MLENSQRNFYALSLSSNHDLLNFGEEGNLVQEPLSVAEEDGILRHIASVVAAPDGIVRDSLNYDGPRVVTFSRLLKSKQFPLAKLIEEVMRLSQEAMGCAVEAEFACNFSDDPDDPSKFSLLQIRPMPSDTFDRSINVKACLEGDVVCSSQFALGNGYMSDIKDVIMVDPVGFDFSASAKVAQEIGRMNRQMGNVKSILIGPGRWGSADPWLGIPVKWNQISKARVIVEVGLKGKPIDPSFGSHFFQNVTSFRIGYFTVNGREDILDWDWLKSQRTQKKSGQVSWIRFSEPLAVYIEGQSGNGLILRRLLKFREKEDSAKS
tara:strand:- start:847 stop:1812 length:966 start_codon:yes stop_codon:yes gene_type:complete